MGKTRTTACIECGQPVTTWGRAPRCRPCATRPGAPSRSTLWRRANPERQRAARARYEAEHRDEIRAKKREYDRRAYHAPPSPDCFR